MYNIGIIMGGVMPVPAVCGGAIETLITSIVKKYSEKDGFRLTIFSVYHKDAVEAAKKYPEVRFIWTHTNSFWNLAKHAIFMAVRGATGKTIRVLQRHYNEIAPVIQNERFDLLIVEGGDEQAVLDIAKGYTRDQLAFHAHIHYIPNENVVKGFGHMIGVSEFVVREYEKACTVPVDTNVLKNAIDLSKFNKTISYDEKKHIRNKLGIKEDDFVVLYVGRLMQIKGIMELMKAIVSIEDRNVKLLCIGSANFGKWAYSNYEKKIKKLSEQHKEQIIFTGYLDNSEIYKYASVADIQCVPTLVEEAAPLVVLEAMASGLPTIVTDSGGMVEYVNEGTSLVVERDDIVDNLINGICFMKDHPEIRKKMSENSKLQSEEYDESIYYKAFLEIMDNIKAENMESSNGK